MSVIQKIQEKGAWIVFILISIALIAFIMMDYSKGGNMFTNTTTLGTVNGDKIAVADFNKRVDMVMQMQGNNSNTPREQVMAGVWQYYVQTALLNQSYKQLGLVSTSRDMDNALFGPNPPQFLQQFVNQQTGQYDANAARNALAQVKRSGTEQQKAQVSELLDQENDQIKLAKYQSLLVGATYIPSWLAQKTYVDNSSVANASIVSVPYTSVSDSAVKVSDAEIMAYVNKHKKQFEQKEETRSIDCIAFSAAPSATDSTNIKTTLNSLKADFIAAKDNAAFVESKDGTIPYYNGYINSNQMQFPDKEQIVATPVDSIYGPYISNGNYVFAKMVGKMVVPDSVKVRHILVATAQRDPQSGQFVQIRDDSSALKRLDSAVADIKAGASFDSIAQKFSDDGASAAKGGVIDYFASGAMMPEFNNFAFGGKTGDTKIVKTQFGYHFIEILGQKGSAEGYNIAYIGRPIEASQQTIDSVNNVAAEFVASNQNQKSFLESAQKKNIAVQPVRDLKENDYQLGSFGSSRDMVKWIYAHKVGEVSQPIEINNNFVVATITSDAKPGLPDAASVRPYLQTVLMNQKKAQIIQDKFKGNTLESYAQSTGSKIVTADSISFQASFIPNIGNEPKVVGAAFNKALLNKVSAPIAGNSGVFAIEPTSVSAKPSLDGGVDAAKATMKQSWLQQIQGHFINALQQDAKIVDYRSKFF